MKSDNISLVLVVFVLLFLASCSKPTTSDPRGRTDPTPPEGITIDTTWHNDTIIHF